LAEPVREAALPEAALLQAYRHGGAYTDCFAVAVARSVTPEAFIAAFYTTRLFKLERLILHWAISRPSTDDEARALARGQRDRFSAWSVEGRAPGQLLMRDEFTGRTRSWLMVEPLPGGGTRLYFGSAMVPRRNGGMGPGFAPLLGFHTLYSRLLLAAARRKLEDAP
jgi:hypothetical protein